MFRKHNDVCQRSLHGLNMVVAWTGARHIESLLIANNLPFADPVQNFPGKRMTAALLWIGSPIAVIPARRETAKSSASGSR